MCNSWKQLIISVKTYISVSLLQRYLYVEYIKTPKTWTLIYVLESVPLFVIIIQQHYMDENIAMKKSKIN